MGGITVLYTYFGGMRSVVWNDCVQFVIYIFGAIVAIFVIVSYLPNGWSSFYEYAIANSKFTMINWRLSLSDPNTLWAGLIGGATLSLGSHGTDQMMVQHYLSARSQRDASMAIFWSGIVVFAQFALFLLIGMLLACFYSHQGALPTVKPDEIFAHFMVHSFPKNTGLIGLMLAAILAAAMSTLSSSLKRLCVCRRERFMVTELSRRSFRRDSGLDHANPYFRFWRFTNGYWYLGKHI